MEETVPFEIRSLADLILETGFRLPELLRLEWRDINLAEGLIRNPYYGGFECLTTDALTVLIDVLFATEPPFAPFIFADAATGTPRSSASAHRLFKRHGLSALALRREHAKRLATIDWPVAYRLWDLAVEKSH